MQWGMLYVILIGDILVGDSWTSDGYNSYLGIYIGIPGLLLGSMIGLFLWGILVGNSGTSDGYNSYLGIYSNCNVTQVNP